MVLNEGDFVKVRYTGRIKETGVVFDTTSEEVAKKEGIYDEKVTFKSQPIVIGAGHVLKGLDEALVGAEVGEEKTVEIPPEKGYGQRDPKLIKVVPIKEFKRQGMTPVPGMRIEAEGRVGKVQSVGAGRVRVDFNYELAGKVLAYEVAVEEKINKTEEKIRHLLELHFKSIPPNDHEIHLEDKTAVVVLPENAKFAKEAQLAKLLVSKDVFQFMEDLDGVEFREVYERPEEPKKKVAKPKAKKKAGAKKSKAETKKAAKKKR
jgi:FKBP-type peptidyl-prolyl cis-trans isomerase SlyD